MSKLKKLELAEVAARYVTNKGLSNAQLTYLFSCLKLSELQNVLKANLNREELLPLGLSEKA